MTVMNILRVLASIAWLTVLVYMLPSVWAMWMQKSRYGDPARLLCAGFALLMISFSVRWLLMPNSQGVWAALYVLSIIWALFTILAARSYGRGPLV